MNTQKRDLRIVFDREVLAAHHAITLEPLATELLRGTIRRVGPLDRDAVVVRVFGANVERVARDGQERGFLRVENSTRRIHSKAARIRGLDGPADTTSARVEHLKKMKS